MRRKREQPITVAEARFRLEEIKECRDDDEMAHSMEDDLRHDVLEAIAGGVEKGMELAEIALETSQIDFARWCA